MLSVNAVAQEEKTANYDPPAWAAIDDSLGHALDLTHDQMKLVQTADENYRKNARAGDKEAMEKRDRDIKAIMLPTQYTAWKEAVRQRKGTAQ